MDWKCQKLVAEQGTEKSLAKCNGDVQMIEEQIKGTNDGAREGRKFLALPEQRQWLTQESVKMCRNPVGVGIRVKRGGARAASLLASWETAVGT